MAPLFLLLISLNALAVTANQLGASTILTTYNSDNWAGVAYADEWRSGVTNYWAVVQWASESIYVGNLSFAYAGYTNPNAVSIWVGLSPAKIGVGTDASTSEVTNTFAQAGYVIHVYSNGVVTAEYFVMVLNNGQILPNFVEAPVPAGVPAYLDVFLDNLFNYTELAQFYVFYKNGSYWSTSVYISTPFNTTGSAMSIVEAPQPTENGNNHFELPLMQGGMIHFTFGYVGPNKNDYSGPGNAPSGTTMYAVLFNLNEASYYNTAEAVIANGWANSLGGWDYLYQFIYPDLGITTTGL